MISPVIPELNQRLATEYIDGMKLWNFRVWQRILFPNKTLSNSDADEDGIGGKNTK
jgi:hypothetical protein